MSTIAEQFPWAVVGGDAAIYERGNWGYVYTTTAKITRVSNTRITLEGGRVFYAPRHGNKLKEYGKDYYSSPDLIPADDPRIAEAKEVQRKEQIRLKARDAAKAYGGDSHSEDKARAAIKALELFIAEWVEQ